MDGVNEDNEEFPGNYILYNKDDDDNDGVPDYDDGYDKDGIPGNEDDENIYEDDLVLIGLSSVQPVWYLTGTVTFDVTSGASKVKVWKAHPFYPTVKEIKDIEISLPETYNTPADLPKVFYVEGIEPSDGPRDVEFKLTYTKAGLAFEDKIKVTVVEVEIKNAVNPNKGVSNDSDDFFFRGPSEPDVKVYYDFLPIGLTATSVKLLIKEGSSTLRQITLSTSSGANLLAEWNGKDASGDYYNKWDFRAEIQVVIDGVTFTSNEHPIAELLYKHRPLVYIHTDEFSGPVAAEFMMDHANLYDRSEFPDEKVADEPLSFSDLSSHNTTDYYQNLDNDYRQSGAGTNEVYCRGTTASGHAFLQYYHFEPSSSLPESEGVWHEGDWEMFQIAVEPNTTAEELQPIAVTGSQHYYGQTIRWVEDGNGPGSQDQDYVGKSGHRPKVYIALNSHATYFRQGDFRCPTLGGSANHGLQYEPAPNDWPIKDDKTGNNLYNYNLRIFHDPMISHWHGNWGEDGSPVVPHDDGPRSPRYRSTAVNVWTHPREFNNYYLKLESYPSGDPAHPECEIP